MIDLIVGTRPNFVKAAPLLRALRGRGLEVRLVHTGQHTDPAMADAIFRDLGLPAPDLRLERGAGSAWHLPRVMNTYYTALATRRPSQAIVMGDVDSTLACALAAKRSGVRVVHVEAGLRCGDPWMPEEQNRRLTDALSDVLFVSEPSGLENLKAEGAGGEVHHVGNVMIDSLARAWPCISERPRRPGPYVVVTLHRPSNVDDSDRARKVAEALAKVAREVRVVFPMHPRTQDNWERFGVGAYPGTLERTGPLGYLDFLSELASASAVVTDSGGVQEEATWLGVPCLTLRPSTERPITIERGTNELVEPDGLAERVRDATQGRWKRHRAPDLWDGRASERIADVLAS